jgi:hypothetical protein
MKPRNSFPPRLFRMLPQAALVLSLATSAVLANTTGTSIGLKFAATDPDFATSGLAPGDTAGVVPSANWNNLTNASGSFSGLLADSSGVSAATPVTVNWSAPNTWRSGANSVFPAGPNKKLLSGYLDTGNATANGAFVAVSNLPSSFTLAGYDVYVYFLSDSGADRGGGYTMTSQSGFVRKYGSTMASPSIFIQDPGNDPDNSLDGNYLRFANLGGDWFTLRSDTTLTTPNGFRAPVNAIEIVTLPCTTAGIANQPLPVIAYPGATVQFAVSATGSLPTYQWRKNGANLSNGPTGSGSTISGATTATLAISGVTVADAVDAGSGFDCIISVGCDGSTTNSTRVALAVNTAPDLFSIAQRSYLKADNTGALDQFGINVAMSGDTLVVAAQGEDSSATGVNGDGSNNNATDSGAVYVFVRSGANWTQQAYLKASNTGANDVFGRSIAISGDTIVVGANNEDSNATGVNGDQSNNSALASGAAYVFVRNGTTWSQQAYLKASNTGANDFFGSRVAISGDTIVVAADSEASNATGVNGNQSDNSAIRSGAVYVFVRTGTTWSQQAYLKASNTGADDFFGSSLAISGDTVVVGAYGEDSNAVGINGDQSNNSALVSGAAYVFVRSGTTWTQEAYLKASNAEAGDAFGASVAISGDTIVIGAGSEDSSAAGVNGNQADNSAASAGAAFVFVRDGTNWNQQAYIKASNTGVSDFFSGVAVSGDTLVVAAHSEDSDATGVNGNQNDNSSADSGAAYVFRRNGTIWTQQSYLKASNTGASDQFGYAAAISGNTIVIGANAEDSNAIGVNGNQSDNSASAAGAAYLFAIPTMAGFNVTGGGIACVGDVGVAVGLSGSETNVTYLLLNNSIFSGVSIEGTGAAISFGNQTNSGAYSVLASNMTTAVVEPMSGTANVIAAPGCTPMPSDLVAFWRGENDALDSSGMNHGTLYGSVAYLTCSIGGSGFNFATLGSYVSVPFSPALQRTNLTVEGWVFAQGTPTTQAGILGTWNDLLGAGTAWRRTFMMWSYQGKLEFLCGVGTTIDRATDSAALPINTWVHVAGTYDGSTIRLYRNGVQVASKAYAGILNTNDQPFYIGRTDAGGDGSDYWRGMIDDVSVYSRALSSNEIAVIYAAASAGKCLQSPALTISPSSTNTFVGGAINFFASGGQPPYQFAIPINNSGGAIDLNSGAYTAGSAPGTDTISVSDAAGSNALATVIVTPNNSSPVVVNPIADTNGTYGTLFEVVFASDTFNEPDAGQTLTYSATGLPAGITFTPATRTFSGTPTAVGTNSVTVTATDNGTPTLSTNDVFDIVIIKALLTATADNKSRAYGQANPALTISYSGFVLGESDSVLNTPPIPATTATSASPVGPYPITLGGGADDHYAFNYVNGTLNITPALLTVAAFDTNRVYGTTNPPLTGSIIGLVNGDNITASFTTAATIASPPGTYPITAILNDPDGKLGNYSVTTNIGTLTINGVAELQVEMPPGTNLATGTAIYFGGVQSRYVDPTSQTQAPDQTYTVTFTGIFPNPYAAYAIQLANSPGGPWSQLPAPGLAPDAGGTIEFHDPTPRVEAYYRLLILTDTQRVFTIRNTGSNDLSGIAVTVGGTNAANFELNLTGTATLLSPGASTTFAVTYVAGDTDARAAELIITGNIPSAFVLSLIGGDVSPPNHAPEVANVIADASGFYGAPFNFTFAANSFSDPDAGQALSYSAGGLPAGITFTPATRTFSGTPTAVGTNSVTVTATDNGTPPLNTNDVFDLVIAKAPLVVTANDTNRVYGTANPTLTGSLVGVVNSDNITATFSTTATIVDPPGTYPILPQLNDPDGRLINYLTTTNAGILTITSPPQLSFTLGGGGGGGLFTLSWSASYSGFVLEYTENLAPPVDWHEVTSGITETGGVKSYVVTSEPGVPGRLYRLRLP